MIGVVKLAPLVKVLVMTAVQGRIADDFVIRMPLCVVVVAVEMVITVSVEVATPTTSTEGLPQCTDR